MKRESSPTELREGVRHGILAAIREDVERRGGRTAGRLALAGLVGVLGALGAISMIAGHPFGHHPSWHVLVVSTVWAGLLVVVSAVSLLGIRTPTLALSHAGMVGLIALGVAGFCGALCPDPHLLAWWSGTSVGSDLIEGTGWASSVLCFGLVSTTFIAGVSAFLAPPSGTTGAAGGWLPATAVTALLLPGMALQSVGTPGSTFVALSIGSATGAYLGVVAGSRVRRATRARLRSAESAEPR